MNAPTPVPMKVKEVTLPTGAFCRVRVLTGRDWIEARAISDKTQQDFVFTLATLCCQIDDVQVTYEQLMDMDLRDVMALQTAVNGFLNGPIK